MVEYGEKHSHDDGQHAREESGHVHYPYEKHRHLENNEQPEFVPNEDYFDGPVPQRTPTPTPTPTPVSNGGSQNAEEIVESMQGDDQVNGGRQELAAPAECAFGILEDNGELRYTRKAVEKTGLEGLLEDDTKSITLFAPDNQAWEDLAKHMGMDSVEAFLEAESEDALRKILEHHVHLGKVNKGGLTNGRELKTEHDDYMLRVSRKRGLGGEIYEIAMKHVDPPGDDSEHETSDSHDPDAGVLKTLEKCNDVVHIIDDVLIPPDFGMHSDIHGDENGGK